MRTHYTFLETVWHFEYILMMVCIYIIMCTYNYNILYVWGWYIFGELQMYVYNTDEILRPEFNQVCIYMHIIMSNVHTIVTAAKQLNQQRGLNH